MVSSCALERRIDNDCSEHQRVLLRLRSMFKGGYFGLCLFFTGLNYSRRAALTDDADRMRENVTHCLGFLRGKFIADLAEVKTNSKSWGDIQLYG